MTGSSFLGVPAKCFVCDRKFKVPAGAASLQSGSQRKPSAKGQELQALRNESQGLKSGKAGAATAEDGVAGGEGGADTTTQTELKAARADISALRSVDVALHGLIYGGYASALSATYRSQARRQPCWRPTP